jgi:stearoyl-CoA desaturase (delta-9 desaturase)
MHPATEPSASPGPLPATKVYGARARRFERRVILAITIIPLLGMIASVVLFARGTLGAHDHLAFVGMYLVTTTGIGVGYHRLFTHRSFAAPIPVRLALGIAGAMAVEGPVIRWVADHRRHHAFSDRPGDPHSPRQHRDQHRRGVLRALWYAHVGWFFDDEKTTVRKYAPDLHRDPVAQWLDRHYLSWVAASLAIPTLIGLACTGTAQGALAGFLWPGLARIFVLQHMTWSINSICHTFGNRPFDTRDDSRNVWLLALPSLGESWHNNHHAFPSSAFHGARRWQIDISGWTIRALELVGLARDVKRMPSDRPPPPLESRTDQHP